MERRQWTGLPGGCQTLWNLHQLVMRFLRRITLAQFRTGAQEQAAWLWAKYNDIIMDDALQFNAWAELAKAHPVCLNKTSTKGEELPLRMSLHP